jgi:hypothetical protein
MRLGLGTGVIEKSERRDEGKTTIHKTRRER